jgi:hypothetical protein
MAYEFPSPAGTLRLMQVQGRWLLYFGGRRTGRWSSPDIAVKAVAQHRSGLPEWDRERVEAPDDLLEWRPLGESL